jgi:hypothetical protein
VLKNWSNHGSGALTQILALAQILGSGRCERVIGSGRSMADLHRQGWIFVFYSLILVSMFHTPEERIWDYVIRNYLPAELFQGRLAYELIRKRSILH